MKVYFEFFNNRMKIHVRTAPIQFDVKLFIWLAIVYSTSVKGEIAHFDDDLQIDAAAQPTAGT